mmetsp:Transcript_104576/g.305324  ORF Transcript_104576/g.305324 Transcript_104576/m.305324 type:complete len:84 (+) Transcript_104576:593-844(+)
MCQIVECTLHASCTSVHLHVSARAALMPFALPQMSMYHQARNQQAKQHQCVYSGKKATVLFWWLESDSALMLRFRHGDNGTAS